MIDGKLVTVEVAAGRILNHLKKINFELVTFPCRDLIKLAYIYDMLPK